MSYAIIRNVKYKANNLKGIYRHNERKNYNYSNKNIDKEATILRKISLLIEILSFNTLLVPYSNKKSKKKFSKNTKSK